MTLQPCHKAMDLLDLVRVTQYQHHQNNITHHMILSTRPHLHCHWSKNNKYTFEYHALALCHHTTTHRESVEIRHSLYIFSILSRHLHIIRIL